MTPDDTASSSAGAATDLSSFHYGWDIILLEVDGVLTSSIDAHAEPRFGMLLMQLLQAFFERLVAIALFHHGQRLGSRSAIGPEERNTVTVPAGIETDADEVDD